MSHDKARNREYMREYRNRPGNKERKRDYAREYNLRPEVRERNRRKAKERIAKMREDPEWLERRKRQAREYMARRWREDPEFREKKRKYERRRRERMGIPVLGSIQERMEKRRAEYSDVDAFLAAVWKDIMEDERRRGAAERYKEQKRLHMRMRYHNDPAFQEQEIARLRQYRAREGVKEKKAEYNQKWKARKKERETAVAALAMIHMAAGPFGG